MSEPQMVKGSVSVEVEGGRIYLVADTPDTTMKFVIPEFFALELCGKLNRAPDIARKQLAEQELN